MAEFSHEYFQVCASNNFGTNELFKFIDHLDSTKKHEVKKQVKPSRRKKLSEEQEVTQL